LAATGSDLQVHNLERQMNHANKDMAHLNSLISSNQELAAALEDKHFQLQQAVMCELKEQEAEAQTLENAVTECSTKKKELLSEVLETERQIMLWERKLQLDKEMQELLDPTVGQVRIYWKGATCICVAHAYVRACQDCCMAC
jgi:coiled-coil domain-containing protein 40